MNPNVVVAIAAAILVIGLLAGWLRDPLWEAQKRIWRRLFESLKHAFPRGRR